MVIQVSDLTFSYERRRVCLEDIAFSVTEREILGFLGLSVPEKVRCRRSFAGFSGMIRGAWR